MTTSHDALPRLAVFGEALTDFYAIRAKDPEDGARTVLELVTERIPARFGADPIADVQVLCPTNRGRLGARALNEMLQAALNPAPPDRIEQQGTTFALGDKVMQLENDYEREVYNGDLGRIVAIDQAQVERYLADPRTIVLTDDYAPVDSLLHF
jgi:exodeoxyribonuclease V alpha subunit